MQRTVKLLTKLFAKLGLRIQRIPFGRPNPIYLWDVDDETLCRLYNSAAAQTLKVYRAIRVN
jgi:hypothetical protein